LSVSNNDAVRGATAAVGTCLGAHRKDSETPWSRVWRQAEVGWWTIWIFGRAVYWRRAIAGMGFLDSVRRRLLDWNFHQHRRIASVAVAELFTTS